MINMYNDILTILRCLKGIMLPFYLMIYKLCIYLIKFWFSINILFSISSSVGVYVSLSYMYESEYINIRWYLILYDCNSSRIHISKISYPLRQLYADSSVPPFLRNCCTLLALPISPEIMDRFWCSRCLNDRVEVLDMMRLFAGGATTPLVVKILTKQPWVKIENFCNFDYDFTLFTGKIWLWLF